MFSKFFNSISVIWTRAESLPNKNSKKILLTVALIMNTNMLSALATIEMPFKQRNIPFMLSGTTRCVNNPSCHVKFYSFRTRMDFTGSFCTPSNNANANIHSYAHFECVCHSESERGAPLYITGKNINPDVNHSDYNDGIVDGCGNLFEGKRKSSLDIQSSWLADRLLVAAAV